MKSQRYLLAFLFLFFFHLGLKAQNTDVYLIKSPVNSLVMEVDNKKMNQDGVKVYLKEPNGKDTQKWLITQRNNNFFTIVNLANGKAMSILSYDQNKEGNPLILNSPNSSELQEWSLSKSFTTGRLKISNRKNSKVLVPYKYYYRSAARILLNREKGRNEEWVLVPVKEDHYQPGYDFSGIYTNDKSGLKMEIRDMGSNIYKAFFNGNCKDESLKGSVGSSGVLVLPLRSSNGARLEIRNTGGGRFNVKVTNMGQLSSRSYGQCNGGTMEGNYRKQQNNLAGDFSGIFQMRYGNQQMEIIKSGYNAYKVVFKGKCNASTQTGRINRRGELEIPLRGGYNDKLFIRKNGEVFNVSITNKNIMNNVCNGGSLDGNYFRKTAVKEVFTGEYRMRSGRQSLEIIKTGYDRYKAVFTGNCNVETLTGRINNRGVLEIPLRGGYNDRLEISNQGNRIKVYITNKNVMNNACNGYSIEGYYDKQSWSSGNNSTGSNFSGRYQLDMQFVQLIPEGRNRYRARFYGDCELTTKTGTVNYNGVLEIPFVGENQTQKMMIRKRGNGIEIKNTSNSPMMGLCRGATLAGFYAKR